MRTQTWSPGPACRFIISAATPCPTGFPASSTPPTSPALRSQGTPISRLAHDAADYRAPTGAPPRSQLQAPRFCPPRHGGCGCDQIPRTFPSPAATRRTVKAQGGAERNPGVSPPYRPRPNGADGTDEGSFRLRQSAVLCAPSGRGALLGSAPRVAPWAVTVGPFGAGTSAEHST